MSLTSRPWEHAPNFTAPVVPLTVISLSTPTPCPTSSSSSARASSWRFFAGFATEIAAFSAMIASARRAASLTFLGLGALALALPLALSITFAMSLTPFHQVVPHADYLRGGHLRLGLIELLKLSR